MAARMRAGGLAAALVAAALVIGAPPTAALADTPTPRRPRRPPRPRRPTPRAQALAARIVALQRVAEQKGEVAEKANERANDAKAASDAAAQALARRARPAAVGREQHAADSPRPRVRRRRAARPHELRHPAARPDAQLAVGGGGARRALDHRPAVRPVAAALRRRRGRTSSRRSGCRPSPTPPRPTRPRRRPTRRPRPPRRRRRRRPRSPRSTRRSPSRSPCSSKDADDAGRVRGRRRRAGRRLPARPPGAAPKGDSVGAKVVRYALAQIGKPYVFGAAGPDSFDCSGLTLAAYASAGVSIGIALRDGAVRPREVEGRSGRRSRTRSRATCCSTRTAAATCTTSPSTRGTA